MAICTVVTSSAAFAAAVEYPVISDKPDGLWGDPIDWGPSDTMALSYVSSVGVDMFHGDYGQTGETSGGSEGSGSGGGGGYGY